MHLNFDNYYSGMIFVNVLIVALIFSSGYAEYDVCRTTLSFTYHLVYIEGSVNDHLPILRTVNNSSPPPHFPVCTENADSTTPFPPQCAFHVEMQSLSHCFFLFLKPTVVTENYKRSLPLPSPFFLSLSSSVSLTLVLNRI